MSRGDSLDELCEPLVVLGDRTNRPGKRGLSCILDELGGKLCSRKEKSIAVGDGNRQIAKQVPFGKENSMVEEALPLMKEKGIQGLLSGIGDVGITSENLIRYLPELPGEKEIRIHSHSDPGNVGEDNRTGRLLEGGDAFRDSCRSIISANRAQVSGKAIHPVGDLEMDASKVTPGSHVQETMQGGRGYLDCRIGNNDLFLGNITSSTSGSVEGLKSSHSLGSKSFNLKGDDCINHSLGDDLLKTCSCSFCLKVAYIWSDLHYQDVKGRLAALGKSQREVASVIQKIDRVKSGASLGPSSLEKTSKLESDLKNQWKSLFLHMQNALIQESGQNNAAILCRVPDVCKEFDGKGNDMQQVSYLELKDLREKCKMDLEAINRTPSSKH